MHFKISAFFPYFKYTLKFYLPINNDNFCMLLVAEKFVLKVYGLTCKGKVLMNSLKMCKKLKFFDEYFFLIYN